MFGAIGLDSSLNEIKRLLLAIVKPLSQVTGSGSNRLSVDVFSGSVAVSSLPTLGTVTTITNAVGVSTVASVTNQVSMGGVAAFELQKAMSHLTFAQTIRARL
jgi:hypothetical protein